MRRGHVRVERRDDDRRAALAASPRISSDGRLAVRAHHASPAPSSIAWRCASSRSPTTTTSPAPIGVGVDPSHGAAPRSGRRRSWSLAGHQLAVEHARRSRRPSSAVAEARGLARLADVAAGERAHGHDPGEQRRRRPRRHEVEPLVRHRQPHLADRLAAVGDGKVLAHHVAGPQHHVGEELGRRGAGCARAPSASGRSGRRDGPARTRSRGPAGPSARRTRSPTAIESVSGLRCPVT